MKRKIFLLLGLLAGLLSLPGCNDEKEIDYDKLPAAARTFIEQYFPQQQVTYAEREREEGGKEYKAVLNNGTELQFDQSGNWQSIECPFSTLPQGILPEAIAAHIAENYPQVSIYKIEKELGGYEVGVTGGLELLYASDGTFIRQDTER